MRAGSSPVFLRLPCKREGGAHWLQRIGVKTLYIEPCSYGERLKSNPSRANCRDELICLLQKFPLELPPTQAGD